MKIEGCAMGAQSANTQGGHQVRSNKVEFALAGNELLHFPRRSETDELLPITGVIFLMWIEVRRRTSERNISHSCHINKEYTFRNYLSFYAITIYIPSLSADKFVDLTEFIFQH